jgi:anti-sigma factor RsiW
MKPCANNRKLIAWLAVDALDDRQTRSLRAHLETCEGCRRYLAEISNVAQKLSAAATPPDIQVAESFHQKVLGALRAEETASAWETLVARLRATLLTWRVVLPAVGATALAIVALSLVARRPVVPVPAPTVAQAALTPNAKSSLDPTISNYHTVANRSLEQLDELLLRQGNMNPSPSPLYTASSLSRANAPD